jgi:hypothetical protein
MKKFLRYKANSDPSMLKLYPNLTHWVFNKKGEELCCIERTKLWGRVRVASLTTDSGVYLTSDCHRQIADFIDSQENQGAMANGTQQVEGAL